MGPAPDAEAKPEAEADPAVLYSYSTGLYGYHYPYYHYGYYGYPYYHLLGKRSAEQQPRFRREAEAAPLPEAGPEADAKPDAEADPWYYYYHHYGYPYPYYGRYWYGK